MDDSFQRRQAERAELAIFLTSLTVGIATAIWFRDTRAIVFGGFAALSSGFCYQFIAPAFGGPRLRWMDVIGNALIFW